MIDIMQTLRIGIASIALAATSVATANPYKDPDPEKVKKLLIEYLKKGGPAAAGNASDSKQIADAGIDLVVGLADLGFPGIGLVLGPLKGLLKSPSQTVPAIVEQRLGRLERNVSSLYAEMAEVQRGLADNSNLDRLTEIRRNLLQMKNLAADLPTLPSSSAEARRAHLDKALNEMDAFLPLDSVGESLWTWDAVRIKSAPGQDQPDIESTVHDQIDIALDAYIQALSLLVATRDAVSAAMTSQQRSRILRHSAFLIGDEAQVGAYGLPYSLKIRSTPAVCGFTASSIGAGRCAYTISCRNPFATRSDVIEEPNHGGSCLMLSGNLYDSVAQALTQELDELPNPLSELLTLAANRLGGGPSNPPTGSFDASTRLEDQSLFVLRDDGRLESYMHTVATQDLRRAPRPAPAPDCSGVAAHLSEACQPPLARLLVREEIKHSLSNAHHVVGDWRGLDPLMAGPLRHNSFVLYAIDDGGLLQRRRIDTPTTGPMRQLDTPKTVGHGWLRGPRVFSGGEGVLYSVAPDGKLLWYKHVNANDGNAFPVFESKSVGRGWGDVVRIWSPGMGIIYAVKPDGTLLWFYHRRWRDGGGLALPDAWEGPKIVGSGWQDFKLIAGAANGLVYALENSGRLLVYRHLGWQSGSSEWRDPVVVAEGWTDVRSLSTTVSEPSAAIDVD